MAQTISSKQLPNDSYAKYQIFGTLSTWEKGYCAARRHIHYCLSVSLPHIDTQKQTEMLPKAYMSPLWSTPHVISIKNSFQMSYYKISNLEHPLNMGSGMMCFKERHQLLLECFNASCRYTKNKK